jgi:hypothetical protein
MSSPYGQPYTLLGNRLAFTSWHYVHPARVMWFDDAGKNVSVHGTQGPTEALFRPRAAAFGVRLVHHSAQRLEQPVIKGETPWEAGGAQLTSLIHDHGMYRAWAGTTWGTLDESRNRAGTFMCYYESDDCVSWRRPACRLIEYDGCRDNNLVATKGGCVFIDPSAPEDERYKWVSEANDFTEADFADYERHRPGMISRSRRPRDFPYYGVRGAVSPDGIRWNVLNRPLLVMMSDTQNIAYYDVRRQCYVLYTREWIAGPQSPRYPLPDTWLENGRRSIGRTESTDFRAFPESRPILEPPPWFTPNQSLYTNGRTSFPGDPDSHLMFPTVWDQGTDTTHVVIATSHDGELWSFLPGEPVLRTSDAGQWDGGCLFASPSLVEMPNGDFAMAYTGYNVPHKYPRVKAERAVGLAIWPRGRVVGIEAPDKGEFTTVSIVPRSLHIRVNALTRRTGGIRIEVLDGRTNTPVEGRGLSDCLPLFGDLHSAPVRWKGGADLGVGDDTPVALRISIEQGTIYYIEFA